MVLKLGIFYEKYLAEMSKREILYVISEILNVISEIPYVISEIPYICGAKVGVLYCGKV